MKKFLIVLAVLVLAGAGAVWAVTRDSDDQNGAINGENSSLDSNGQTDVPSNEGDEENEETTTIIYSETGFSPSTLTVDAGTTVTIINNSPSGLDFASGPHPVHTDNPELNTGFIPSGESATVTLNTTGSWGFHNHIDETKTGRIVVE
jgi:plastocyanin